MHLQKSHFHIWIYMHAPGTKDGHRFGVQGMTIYVHMTIMKNFIWSKDMCNIHVVHFIYVIQGHICIRKICHCLIKTFDQITLNDHK